MYNGIGLTTVRGSGTNGYVQSNKAYVKPINVRTATELNRNGMSKEEDWKAHTAGRGNAEIMDHARKRAVEVQVAQLRDDLEDQRVDDVAIEERCDSLRQELLKRDEPRLNPKYVEQMGGTANRLLAPWTNASKPLSIV
ncbi:hypothetical protein M885DRAFT_187109 [Pelagophyceae sp. CCMP2097]|nr:hypothetical protein M885DRAFT_187109 [Pelagophyceae sp. CCMP2097]